MKIYTKKGDAGSTSLYGGGRYLKDDTRIEAYGTIDELNSYLGLLIVENPVESQNSLLVFVQNMLFNIGANLATRPGMSLAMEKISEHDIRELEDQIDALTDTLPELKHFILPGGDKVVAYCHVCRTICRRAERRVVSMHREKEELDVNVIKFLNRLSDYLFVLARAIALVKGVAEVKWIGRSEK